MSLISWAVLIILALIAIIAILALALYFCFWSNDGASPGFGVFLAVVAALLLSAIYPSYSSSELVPAVVIAGAIIVAICAGLMHILLPSFDNKDVILAARPILLFTAISGIAIVIMNMIKVLVA